MDALISPNKSAFIKGKYLFEGVVMVKEVIDSAKRGKQCLIFKVDFEKEAYDSINGGFRDNKL